MTAAPPANLAAPGHAANISPAGQSGLLELSFARIRYGFGAMILVSLPFIFWYATLGQEVGGLLLWMGWYVLGALVVGYLFRSFTAQRAQRDHAAVLQRWLPRVQGIAFVYGISLAVPLALTSRHAPFEFLLVYLMTVAAIVAGHSVHSSPVISVFRAFFLTGWGTVTVLVPYAFPSVWYYVLPLNLVLVRTMLKHSTVSHNFYVQNIALQEEAARLAEDFRQAKLVAEEALQDKNRFLSTASHDLRQPVHAMGFLVESIAFRNRDAALLPALVDLKRSIGSLNLMFNSLLDLTKLESGAKQPQLTVVEIDPILEDVATLFREEAHRRGLSLRTRFSRGGAVHTDPLLLRQSLVNLTQNALRYTARGGVLLCARRRGPDWRLEVWDTGMGVGSDDKGKIFSPFYRGEYAWKLDNAGHGLGLSVVARCAQLMGAELGLESVKERGSWFWLRLPAELPSRSLTDTGFADDPPYEPLKGHHGRCLVVEDDVLAAAAWTSMLQAWGVDIRCVTSGAQALALLETGFLPQAVLCDQRVRSGESGFEVLQALLARVPTASGAMVSGEYDSPELRRAEAEGYLVLRKPVEVVELHTLMSRWLGRPSTYPPL